MTPQEANKIIDKLELLLHEADCCLMFVKETIDSNIIEEEELLEPQRFFARGKIAAYETAIRVIKETCKTSEGNNG